MADRLQVNVRLDDELDQKLEDYRRKQARIPSRTDAIKELMRIALACEEERRQK